VVDLGHLGLCHEGLCYKGTGHEDLGYHKGVPKMIGGHTHFWGVLVDAMGWPIPSVQELDGHHLTMWWMTHLNYPGDGCFRPNTTTKSLKTWGGQVAGRVRIAANVGLPLCLSKWWTPTTPLTSEDVYRARSNRFVCTTRGKVKVQGWEWQWWWGSSSNAASGHYDAFACPPRLSGRQWHHLFG